MTGITPSRGLLQASVDTQRNLSSAREEPGRSIFQQDWWLTAAAPDAWERVEAHWDNVLVGSMAFVVRKRAGLRFIELPPLTRTLSPVICPPPSRPSHRLANVLRILDSLLHRLPRHERLELCLRHGCETALPFVMLNYAVAHTFTFQAHSTAAMAEGMHQKTRNVVNKAQRDFEVSHTEQLERFLRLHTDQRRGEDSLDLSAVRRLFQAAHARGQSEILCAVNQRGQDCASAIVIWDDQTLYYWLSARDPGRASNGANSLLIVHAMQRASELGLMFDMDGFVGKSSGQFLAKFGLTPAVRPFVNGSSTVWRLFNLVSSLRGVRHDRHYRF